MKRDGVNENRKRKAEKKNISFPRGVFALCLLVFIIIGAFYAYTEWKKALDETETSAIHLAKAAEAGLNKELILPLNADLSDLDRAEYDILKDNLAAIADADERIVFTYIFIKKQNTIYFLVDSVPDDDEDNSPPGQEYWEADEETHLPFDKGQIVLTEPSSDRWGNWVSVYIPMKDSAGNVIAVFGVDYPAESWYDHAIGQLIHAIISVILVMIVFFALLLAIIRNRALKAEKLVLEELSIRLEASETLFRTVFEQAPIGIAIGRDYKLISKINPMFEAVLGRTAKEITEMSWIEYTHPDDIEQDLENFSKFKAGEIDGYFMPKRFVKPDGTVVWVNMTIARLKLRESLSGSRNHLCLIEDITDRIRNEKVLKESERSKTVLLSHLPGMAYRCWNDDDWTMEFISDGCLTLTGYEKESLLFNNERSFRSIIVPEYVNLLRREWETILSLKKTFRYEYEIITASGRRKWVLEMGQGIYDDKGNVEALEGIVIDIDEQKNREAQIIYMLEHDYLTGLYNRKYYEEKMHTLDNEECLPLSIILADISGVRLINDAFGYAEGDMLLKKTAEI